MANPIELPLPSPGAMKLDPDEEPMPVDAAIGRLIFREGAKPGRQVFVGNEEFLARLAALSRKFSGFRHRHEQWTIFVEQARETFDRMGASHSAPAGVPHDVSGSRNLSYTDLRIENELEAFLFAARSTLDILARVVAAHLPGRIAINSYREIRKFLNKHEPGLPLAIVVEAAWAAWIEDMTERRDAAGHYVALTLRSEIRDSMPSRGPASVERSFVAIPEVPSKASLSVWRVGLPIPTQTLGKTFSHEGKKFEAHAIFDRDGKLILLRNGPLPNPEESIDGSAYVNALRQKMETHIEEVLAVLAEE